MGIAGGNISDGYGINGGGGGTGVQSIVAGMNITVDNADPQNPIVSSTADDITVVANYSALPDPTTVLGEFYWCSASQGTSWLPGSSGGTYYSAGLYYSNGTTWEYLAVPYQATQSGVNAGTITDQFVTPFTFQNSTQLAGKISLNGSSPATTGSLWMGAFRGLSWENPAGAIDNSITGNSAQGYVQIQGADHLRLYSKNVTNEIVRFTNLNGWYSNIIQPNNFNTNITMPSSSGTLALLSNIPSVSGFITLTSLSAISPLAYNSTTGVFSMPAAATAQDGYLTFADWNTFNGKQGTLVSGTNIKTVNGTTLLGSGDLGIISPTYGGTGVNNGSSTITIGGNVAFTGSFNATIAVPRSTTWTLPNTASETLAGLGTAQTFTAQNTFSSSSGTNIYSINVRNVANNGYLPTLSYVTGDKLLLAAGTQAVQVKTLEVIDGSTPRIAAESSSAQTVRFGSGFQSAILLGTVSAQVVWASYSMNFSGSSVTIVGATPTLMNSGAGNSFTIRTAAVGAGSTPSGNLALGTGDLTSATAPSGSVCIYPGAKGSGGTLGNIQLFLGATTATANSMEGGMVIGNRTTSPTNNYSGGTYLYANANNLETTGSFYLPLIGTGLGIKVGTNGRLFTATLTAGTVTVSNSSVTVNTRPIITLNTGGSSGTLGLKYNWVCTSGQIVITSLTATGVTEVLDTSTIQVYLIEGL